jgi:hypothetical protein
MGIYLRNLFSAAAMLALPAADAYIVHGHDLHDVCSTDAEVCQAYVVGVLEGFDASGKLICLPSGSSGEQYMVIFINYLQAHPERLHEPAARLLLDAIFETYPCD